MSTARDPSGRAVASVTAVAVALLALVPVAREGSFYFWDDSAAVFVPTWRAIGLELISGRWPTLRPDLWMGGNWVAEAQFGLWNPVNLAVYVLVALLPDLALAATVVKVAFMVLLSLGALALLREYGAAPWIGAAVAVALPFTGFTLYFDASMWASGLIALAWTPWFWWAARRCAHDRLNPLVLYGAGYLLLTGGSPYGALSAVVALAAVGVESVATGRWAGLGRLVVTGAGVGPAALVAFVPVAASAGAGWRSNLADTAPAGDLSVNLTMLAGASTPSLLPFMRFWDDWGTQAPIVFGTWFLLPVLPWIDWGALRHRLADLLGPLVAAGVFAVLVLGPSTVWLFRWPARLLPYLYLAALIAVAVGASRLRADRLRTRLGATGLVIVVGAWLAFAARPDLWQRHLTGTALVVLLAGGLAAAARFGPRAVPAVLLGGTAAVLLLQTSWLPVNTATSQWRFPTSVAAYRDYAARHEGPVVQVANVTTSIPLEDRPDVWAELLAGALPAAAGVESSVSYSGVGHTAFASTLCLDWNGSTCPDAFERLWRPAGTAVPVARLADALKTRTVVVQLALVPGAATRPAPPGWRLLRTTDRVAVFGRSGDLPWPDSRLAAVTNGVAVASAVGTPTTERVRVTTGQAGGALQFARLAWPGYTASVDGRAVPLVENAQGLLELSLPARLDDALVTLDFRPPGYAVAVPLVGAGFAVALAQSVLWGRRRPTPRRAVAPRP